MPVPDFTDTAEAASERREVAAGRLPERYAEPWGAPFLGSVEKRLPEAKAVLDVGSGARPTIPPKHRPAGCEYVGLDISARELDRAPDGSYDRKVVADIGASLPENLGEFDIVVSWQVLEHVRSLTTALENMRLSLRPGGLMVAQLSGAFAFYALAGRVVPHRLSSWAMNRLLGADPQDKFPVYYDKCWYTALDNLLAPWSSHRIEPRYRAGGYLRFSRPLQRAYLRYEDWAHRTERRNLATHYVVVASP